MDRKKRAPTDAGRCTEDKGPNGMTNSSEKLINLVHQKLRSDRIKKTNIFESEIKNLYLEILGLFIKDYQTYRNNFPNFLESLEENDAIAYSLSVFFELYESLLGMATDNLTMIDLSILQEEVQHETLDKFLKLFEKNIKYNRVLRISETTFEFKNLNPVEIRGLVSSLVHFLQGNSKNIEWTPEQAQHHMLQLITLKSLLHLSGSTKLFYFCVTMFLDRLNSSEYFQAARDVTEEIILASFKDQCAELGFLNAYHCYSNQGSIHAAILYVNMSIYIVTHHGKPLLDKYMKEIIWETIKYFRNTKLYPFIMKIYHSIPKSVRFSDYERRSIDHSYYSSLLATRDDKLPDKILEYLNKEREGIFNAGVNEAMPWLLVLYNLRRIYPNTVFSPTGLGYYLNTFEAIVPQELVEKYKNIINGASIHNKEYLKASLIKLNETRNISDVVYDMNHAVTIASRLIEDSFREHDEEAVLLAMILKSDFSLIFRSKETTEFRPFELPDSDLKNSYSLYADHKQLTEILCRSEYELIVWLAVTEGKVFQLSLLNGKFLFSELSSFDWNAFNDLKRSNYFSSFSFNDTIKDAFGVQKISLEEHLAQQEKIRAEIAFAGLSSVQNARELLIVKDMDLARFPHNLLLDENDGFIHANKPVANILSTEWYLSCKDDDSINIDFTKSIWIPTESGDFTLNKLYDSLEPVLQRHHVQVFNKTHIPSPLSSDVSIVCSHGNKDIASLQVIYPGDDPLEHLEGIIGFGKILIFFVCHSGSYKDEYFRNNITSLVKVYIAQGYRAVIAPFWALHVNIPSIWLDSFVLSLDEGLSVNNSVFQANKAVSEQYQTPVAWACMHLYGNPHLRIKKS